MTYQNDAQPRLDASEVESADTISGDEVPGGHRRSWRYRTVITAVQIAILIALLAAWQWVPVIPGISGKIPLFNRFFISSPSQVATWLGYISTGGGGHGITIWPYLLSTIGAALVGTAIGIALGGLVGLFLSNSKVASNILTPFIIAANATPRIALIPVVVLMFGITHVTAVVSAIMIVFFVAFFNAYEGGSSVPTDMLHYATLMGASKRQVVRYLRAPYSLAWTLAVLPLAVTFGLISVVTAELLAGVFGIGSLLESSIINAQAALTFSVVVILSVVGVILSLATNLLKRRLLHWWPGNH